MPEVWDGILSMLWSGDNMSTDDYDKFLDWNVREVIEFLEDNEQYGDDWSEQKKGLNDLLAEVKRLREVLAEIKGTIDEYIHDVWDGNLEGWQCASDNIAALGIKSEWEEEE